MNGWLVLVLALCVLGGCGGGGDAAEEEPARLEVWETLPEMPWYIEGTIGFLRVESVDTGAVLVDGRVTDPARERGKAPLFTVLAEPGEYRVLSHQRPCDGNCSLLDPPTGRCETTVRVDGAPVRATVVLARSGGCEIRVAEAVSSG